MKIVFNVIVAFVVSCSFAKDEHTVSQSDALQKVRNSPVNFTRNDGQIDTHGKADCRFTTNIGGANYFFCADGIISDFRLPILDFGLDEKEATDRFNLKSKIQNPKSIKGHVLKLNFLNRTNFLPEITGQDEQEYKCNYFIGSDAAKWHTNVPNYSRVMYKDVWEGIDVVYRSASCQLANGRRDLTSRATLEYDVIVHPGANPNQIQFTYEGQDALSIDSKGNLVLKTSVGDVIEQTPYVYQIIDGVKVERFSRFLKSGKSNFTFSVGEYDPTQELVIDPVYSTFIGGSGGSFSYSIAVDIGGNAYITGNATASNGFPTGTGRSWGSGANVFVAKISPEGKLIYAAFLGGSSGQTSFAIAVDVIGNAYITGKTWSKDFPVTAGAFDTVKKSPNSGVTYASCYITKIGSQGNNLLFSTYLGGSVTDFGYGIAVDTAGCVFVAGTTASPDFPVFPITPPTAYDITYNGKIYDGFITKMNSSGTGLIYSTFLGGSKGQSTWADNAAQGIAIDHDGNAYVTGWTSSIDFPTTPGAFQDTVASTKTGVNAFVTKLNSSGTALVYSTYLCGSGSGNESGSSIAVDKEGNAYVTGITTSSNFPVTTSAHQIILRGGQDAFVTKITPNGNALVFSTFLGGSKSDEGWGIAADAGGNAYVTGRTFSSDFLTTSDAYQPTFKGGSASYPYDAFVTKISHKGDKLSYSTYLGGSDRDQGYAVAVGPSGNVYVTGETLSSDFPTTNGAYKKNAYGTAFVSRFILTPILSAVDTLKFNPVLCSEDPAGFDIENLSTDVALKIDTIMFTGTDAANFSFATPPKFPITISALADTQIVLQLTRVGAAGTKTAFLNIHSNDDAPLSDTLKKVTLIGVIDSIGVVTLRKNITFGKLYCDDVSFDTVVQVKNKGLQQATIVPTVSGDGATSFTVTPSSAAVVAGAVTNFTVHFQPSGNGNFSARIKFSDDACDMTFDTTYVTGSKVSDVSLTSFPSLIDFGEHCHSSVVDSFIIVHNTSNATVTLDPAVMSGSGFTVLAPTTSVTLDPDSSIKYRIRFTSTGVGNYQGSISILGKPCNIRVSNQLRGSEIEPPKITLNPTTVFFDTLDCSETERFTKVKVKNIGGRTITLKPVIIGDTGSYHAQPESITIPKNSFFNVKIIFHPNSVGQHSASLFFDDMLCGLLKDSVRMRGFKKAVGAITGRPLPLGFDTMNCSAGERDTLSLWIKNTGDQVLNLNTPTVSGNGFVIENANGVLGLAPGDSIEYRIIFTPDGEGTYLGTFTITGTCNVLFSCPLSGVCSYTFDVAEKGAGRAGEFFLGQNHPNPFSHSCQLSVVSRQSAKFEIRDMLGRVVYQRSVASATTELTIDRDELPNGVYLYSLNDGKNIQSRMMMVVK